jgi:hypothetical protein
VRENSILSPRPFLTKSLLAFLVLLAGSSAWACSVPVFRYALEHWRSDPYQVVFFHRGELTPEQEALLTRLSPAGKAGEISANVEVVAVDLDQAKPDDPRSKDDLALWESQNTDTLPWMVVRYPLSIRNTKVIWAGEPAEESIDLLLDSPKRREIAERILKGDTAVWVFLESGNEEADSAAFLRLRTELKKAEQELELPPPDPQDVASGLISVDQASLQVKFSTLRISRTDAQEARFIDMLLDMEPDLRDEEYAHEPMAFPMFGRGRALSFLIGKGIDRDVIFSDSRFLVGPCSCQVKEQNPGVDMLMAVDWDRSVISTIHVDESLPPLPVIGPLSEKSDSESPQEAKLRTQGDVSATGGETADVSTSDEPITTAEGAAATTTEDVASKAVGSKVLTTMVMFLAAAAAGIAVLSMFLMKRPGA